MRDHDHTTTGTKDPKTPRAYSYVRFSTPEQAKGHSRERQTERAEAWAEKKGITLDTELTFEDHGVSGFTGANMETGRLGAFLACVKDGLVPKGSWLVVESLDRISRQAARKAVRTIEDIVEAGIVVVDLSDGEREYSAETLDSDPMLFMMMVVRFIRANEESTLKGDRVHRAAEARQKRLAQGGQQDRPYTRRLPAWVRWDDASKQYALIEDRAALVRRMFELTTEGWGRERIARWLNETGVDTWGAGGWKAKYWHKSYVRKILSNVAVVGVFVPHRAPKAEAGTKQTRTPLEPIANVWPAAIERELFDQVQSILETVASRGRNAGKIARSIFAGVMRCHRCGDTVTRVSKGKHQYLVCSGANVGKCTYETVPYQEAEDELVHVAARMLHEAPRGRETAKLDAEIRQLETELDAADDLIRDLLDELSIGKSTAVRTKLREAEAERADVETRLRDRRERRDRMTSANVKARLEAVERELTKTSLDVAETNKALRAAVRKMVIWAAEGRLEVWWHHSDTPQEVPFATRRMRWDSDTTGDDNGVTEAPVVNAADCADIGRHEAHVA